MKWFRKRIAIVTVMAMLCMSIFFIVGNTAYADPDPGSNEGSGGSGSEGSGSEGSGSENNDGPAKLTMPTYDTCSGFIAFYYQNALDGDDNTRFTYIDPTQGVSNVDAYGIKWVNEHPEGGTFTLNSFPISPNTCEGNAIDANLKSDGHYSSLDPNTNYTVDSANIVFNRENTQGQNNPNPDGTNTNFQAGKLRVSVESFEGHGTPDIHWENDSTALSGLVDIDADKKLVITLTADDVTYLQRLHVNEYPTANNSDLVEYNSYEDQLKNASDRTIQIPINHEYYYEISFIFSNQKNVRWRYPGEGGAPDEIVENAKLYMLNEHGVDNPNPENYSTNTDQMLTIGETYYFKLVPDYGYQVTSLQINDGPHLTPIDGDANTGIFKFIMTNSNFHFKGIVSPADDVIANSSTKVSGATIAGSEHATESGNVRLSISDATTDSKATSVISGSSAVGTVDLGLEKIISKGNGNYWESPINTFEEPVSITLNVPAGNLGSNETYTVIRNHDGKYEDLGATYNSTTGALTFDTNEFSEYTIVKKVGVAETTTTSNSDEDTSNKQPSAATLEKIRKEAEEAAAKAATLPPVPQDDVAVTVDGTVIDTWEDLNAVITTTATPKLTQIVVGTKDATLPASTFKTLNASNSTGLHLFLGEKTAITFLNDKKLKNQAAVDLTCKTTTADNAVEIAFTNNAKLKATVVLHSVVPANAKEVILYKINSKGKKVKVATLTPTASGNVCYPIKELATYRIEYK